MSEIVKFHLYSRNISYKSELSLAAAVSVYSAGEFETDDRAAHVGDGVVCWTIFGHKRNAMVSGTVVILLSISEHFV